MYCNWILFYVVIQVCSGLVLYQWPPIQNTDVFCNGSLRRFMFESCILFAINRLVHKNIIIADRIVSFHCYVCFIFLLKLFIYFSSVIYCVLYLVRNICKLYCILPTVLLPLSVVFMIGFSISIIFLYEFEGGWGNAVNIRRSRFTCKNGKFCKFI